MSARAGSPQPGRVSWHRLVLAEVLEKLGTGPEGLEDREAARRLATDGLNALVQVPGISPVWLLLGQFQSLLVAILVVSAIISAAMGDWVDAVAIVCIVVINATVGFYQEFNAGRSISALKKIAAPQAKVLRGRRVSCIPAARVVCGDVLLLEAGDLVAADARLLEAAALQCIESTLTGESEAVRKSVQGLGCGDVPLGDRCNMVFLGSSVSAGTGRAVVVATGMRTELGRIAGLLETAGAEPQTPLQKKLDSLGRILVWATLGIVAVMAALGAVRGEPLAALFMTAVSLAVAAVPEGLPAIVTVALSLGVLRLSRRSALVRRLAAVETLGATTVICTDKTGTLTVGEMTVCAFYADGLRYTVTGEGYGLEGEILTAGRKVDVKAVAALRQLAQVLLGCNQANLVQREGRWRVIGDPTEGALLAAGRKAGGELGSLDRDMPKVHTNPFDSERRRASVVRRLPDGRLRVLVNGAPGALLGKCSRLYTDSGVQALTGEDRERVLSEISVMASEGLRVLGAAYADMVDARDAEFSAESVEGNLVFVGLSGMRDPPRPEAKGAILKCRTAGIRVVMITGDHPRTAMAIARELGIADEEGGAITGQELEKLTEGELLQSTRHIAVYARVSAAHKLQIVRSLRATHEVVAMTGDGVNDSPAIQEADIGIAMGKSGTEVTRQASDMIITDDNFATIVAAVEGGRGIYDNIRKTLQYLLAGNAGELMLMAMCVVSGLPMALLPIHLLWINLVTDGLPALCLATDAIDPEVMSRPPRPPSERIMDRVFLQKMCLAGALTAGVAFGVYVYGLQVESLEVARSHAFAVLVFSELLRALGARSETKPVWRMPLLTNVGLVLVVLGGIGFQILIHHHSGLSRVLKTAAVSTADCLLLLLAGSLPLLVLEMGKQTGRRKAA